MIDKKIGWRIRATATRIFPELDNRIGVLYLVAKTYPGVILENTGTPLMILLDPRWDTKIRLTAGLETESDHFLVMKYRKNQDPTDQRFRNVFKVAIDNRKPNVLIFHPILHDTKTFKHLLLDDLGITMSW